jgi:hypothetical protein
MSRALKIAVVLVAVALLWRLVSSEPDVEVEYEIDE